ncbi:MAG: DNA-3-methyladenine glycosylase [Phycisphaerales bacterium]|nr:DNA-3-methyladenine glycosylase [Phycisphaerales bacterium]
MPPLSRRFFTQDAETLARKLLGCELVRTLPGGERLAGRIVETEAYLGVADRGSHTFGARRTARNESMWRVGGTAYVYFTYGMHHCMNVVAGRAGEPVAVLIRALEPLEGIDLMRAHRVGGRPRKGPLGPADLCSGPARLCQALAIDRALDGLDLTGQGLPGLGSLQIERRNSPAFSDNQIAVGPRVGLGGDGDWTRAPLRFAVAGSPWMSRPRI